MKMRIHFNVTGTKRKSLVGAISQELNAPAQYLGAPTFAYEVGGYHIDKNGTVEGADNLDLEDVLHRQGFDVENREYDEPDTYESGIGNVEVIDEFPDIDQHHPGQYANHDALITEAMQRQLNDAPSFEDLQIGEREELGLGRQRRDPWGEDGMRASDVPEIGESDAMTIEMPLEGFTERALENLEQLIASKAGLIKKAVGADAVPVIRSETTLRFPWFKFNAEPEEVSAYSCFIRVICTAAKEQKRVTAKEKIVENEKFAFRVFLIRLGFVGDEYKNARKILLRNLSGNSAFKNGGKAIETEVSQDE
jgi:hypothetical protein